MGEERSCGGDGNRDVLARMGLARRTSRSAKGLLGNKLNNHCLGEMM